MKTYGIKTDDFLNFCLSQRLSVPDLVLFMAFEPRFVSMFGLLNLLYFLLDSMTTRRLTPKVMDSHIFFGLSTGRRPSQIQIHLRSGLFHQFKFDAGFVQRLNQNCINNHMTSIRHSFWVLPMSGQLMNFLI